MKKLVSALLMLTLLAALVACGGGGSSSTSTAAPPAASTSTSASGSTSTGGAAPSGEAIKIGLYGPLTGQHVISGEAMVQGAELAIDQINKEGGILGRPVELMKYDDKSTPETAVQVVTKMVEVDNVDLILASIHSGNILATADIVEDSQTPSLGLGTSPSWLDGSRKYLFRVLPSNILTNQAMIDVIVELGITKMAILYRADEAGVTNNEGFTQLCADAGVELVASEAFQPTDTDYSGQINKIVRSGAEGVMCFGTSGDPMVMLNQLYQGGFEGKIFGPEIFSSAEVKKVAGEAAENVIFAAPYCVPQEIDWANGEREKQFLEDFVAYFGDMPKSDVCYRTYDAMMIYRHVAELIGSTDGEAVADAISDLDGFEGLAGTFNYKTAKDSGMYGEGVLTCRSYVIEGGRDVLLTPEKLQEIKDAMAA